jgi:hypothetical protein
VISVDCDCEPTAPVPALAVEAPYGLGEDLVHLLTSLLTVRRLQMPHRRFHIAVPKPLLNRPQVNPRPQGSRRERRSELVEPEIVLCREWPVLHTSSVEKVQLRNGQAFG